MNTNPNAVTVLCYGDSNTYGQKPDKTGRYDANVRWTGILQDILGSEYYIIEEGLGSRTTDLDFSKKLGRNGKTLLAPLLDSHDPLDIVILMLGTNDLKIQYRRTSEEVAEALSGLVGDVRMYGHDIHMQPPRIILVSPIEINAFAPRFEEFYKESYDDESMDESRKLVDAIKITAETKGCVFLNAALVSEPGEDGVHFDEKSQRPLAELVARSITNMNILKR